MENDIINTEVMEDVTGELIEGECAKTDHKVAAAFGLGALAVVGGIIFYNRVAKPIIAKIREKRAQIKSEPENTETGVDDDKEET